MYNHWICYVPTYNYIKLHVKPTINVELGQQDIFSLDIDLFFSLFY